ncbi:MAG: phosphatidylglycerophosphatase A [Bacteroidetes bacterium]|nr:phosphatidylglycerophosphatase A [Bacteroidota bacterium]
MRFLKKRKTVNENFHPDIFSTLFSSCFYIGFIPKASGTFGSIFGLIFFLFGGFYRPEILVPVIILCFAAGIFASGNMMKRYGDDPSEVIVDEVIGMWITVLVFFILSGDNSALTALQAAVLFLTFRFFDIFKIQPAKYFDKLETAFGVMMDDVIAGIYAGAASYLALKLIKSIFQI